MEWVPEMSAVGIHLHLSPSSLEVSYYNRVDGQPSPCTFYRKLGRTLEAIGLTAGVREACLPACADVARGGLAPAGPKVPARSR